MRAFLAFIPACPRRNALRSLRPPASARPTARITQRNYATPLSKYVMAKVDGKPICGQPIAAPDRRPSR